MTLFFYLLESSLLYWVVSGFLMRNSANPKPQLTGKKLAVVIFNQLIVTPVTVGVFIQLGGFAPTPTSLLQSGTQIVLSLIAHNILFYIFHRLMHVSPFLYRNVHYLHHEHRDTQPWTAVYCSPVEHVICNVLPLIVGPWYLHMDWYTLRLWALLATLNTVNAHCSVNRSEPNDHDVHHRFPTHNFGTGNTLDKIFGTYQKPPESFNIRK